MKKIVSTFFKRGLIGCGVGPVVLAIIYYILNRSGIVDTLSVNQVCIGIFSVSLLAFIIGGLNVIYQIERLPLIIAILIHGFILYLSYLGTYLVNDWLELGLTPIFVFTSIFVVGFLVIWIIVYAIIRKNTNNLNKMLKEKQKIINL